MLRFFVRSSFAFILFFSMAFTLVSCNDNKVKESNDGPAELVLSPESSLGQFLAKSSKPAVIKFYAEWCSTCKQYEPTFRKVVSEMSNSIDFYEVDVDDNDYKELLKQLKISRIPETVFVNKDRTNITKKLGAIPKAKLEKLINTQLL